MLWPLPNYRRLSFLTDLELRSFFSVFFPFFAIATLTLAGCARQPLALVHGECLPEFADDMRYASLKSAIEKNLDYLRKHPPGKKIFLSDKTYPVSTLIQSQEFFLKLLAENPAPDTLSQRIRENFDIYQATGTSGINLRRKMLVTGYYQPVFQGSLKRQEPYIYPLYTVPPDLVHQVAQDGKKITGRLEGTKLVPYWTRKEIEKGGKAAGSEIVWLKDPFDTFLLHVQGSGLIRLRDGSLKGIHYAAKNGRQYKSIGKFMVQTGKMSLEEAGIDAIRAYLAKHPQEIEEILHYNPSFIFFNWSKSHGAVGNLGKELTAGRSIAVDQKCIPPGALGFLSTRSPVVQNGKVTGWQDLKRFVVSQDTGSAIRGPGRVDLYMGTGSEAGMLAGSMKESGQLYVFILKKNRL